MVQSLWLVFFSMVWSNMMMVQSFLCILDPLLTRVIGTPATTSQLAKDVVTFLNWAAEPEHDIRKQYGIKAVILCSTLTLLSIYIKRFKWSPIKNRKIGELYVSVRRRQTDVLQCTTRRLVRHIRKRYLPLHRQFSNNIVCLHLFVVTVV